MVDILCGAESGSEIAEKQDNDQDIAVDCDGQENVEITLNTFSKSNQEGEEILIRRTRSDFLTPGLAAALDILKVSSRDAIHLLSAVLEAVGLDSSEFFINSIRK